MNYFDILFAKYKFEQDHPPIIKRTTGNPIVLTDAADAPLVECKTEIQGSQDLHGQDKPWVGGAGKNMLNLSFSDDVNTISGMAFSHTDSQFTLNGTATTPSYYSLTFSTPPNVALSTDYTFSITVEGTIPSGLFSLVFYNGSTPVVQARVNTTDSKKKTFQVTSSYDKCVLLMESIQNGGVYNCTIKTQLESGSTATTFAPYSNICPITAYTEGEIEVRGKNAVDDDNMTMGLPGYQQGQTIDDVTTSTRYAFSAPIKVTDQNIIVSAKTESTEYFTDVLIICYDENGNYLSTTQLRLPNVGQLYTADPITPSDGAWIRVVAGADASHQISTSIQGEIQAEIGSSATDYEEYRGATHTTAYPSAIYRGSEDVVNGEVENLSEAYSFTGNETIEQAGGNPFVFDIVAPAPFNINIGEDIARPWSHFKGVNYKPAADMLDGEARQFTRSGSTTYFSFCNHNLSSVSDCATWLAQQATNGTPVQLVPKKNHTTSSVTPTNLPIKSLLGYNHIESTTGELDITYLTQNYQNFVDIIENNLGTRKGGIRKGGIKPLDVFRTLEVNKEPEEEEKKDEKVEDVKR